MLSGLVFLLAARALFYHQVGSAVGWTPKLDLGPVVLPFRSDLPGSVVLYSCLSFGRVCAIYYFWLLAIVLINWAVTEPDPLLRLFRLHLGRMRGWPWPVLAFLPLVGVTALWFALHPLLQRAGVVIPSQEYSQILEQGLLLTLTLVLSLKYLLPVFLILEMVAAHVYLGMNPVWSFVTITSKNILRPLSPLPLRLAKVDLAPITATILILVLLHWLPQAIQNELGRRHLVLWPQ